MRLAHIILTLLLASGVSFADTPTSNEQLFNSKGKVDIQGKNINYTTTAKETFLLNDKGEPEASIFSFTYLKSGTTDYSKRPVTFVFNGGPGSSSVWLHLGLFGPKRVVVPSDAEDDGAAPFQLVNNEFSLLDVTDIVLIDPVGTGFSKPLGETEGKAFWGIKQDAQSLARFIRQWLSENNRWNSPKYLAGESYGTTRAAALTAALHEGFDDVALNGVMLISAILDFDGARPAPHNDTVPITNLPTYAATAWYHGKVKGEPSLEAFLDKARQFALTQYASALLLGKNRIASEQRSAIREKLAHFTGLSETYLEQTDLYVTPMRFMKELLRDQGKVVGRLDSRYLGKDLDDAGEHFTADPSGYGISAAYTAALNYYMTNELGINIVNERYQILSGKPGASWDWSQPDGNPWPIHTNVAPYIGDELRRNKDYRVLVASGYYDLATPFFGPENSFAKTGMPNERVTFTYYEAGHMMYVHQPSLKKLSQDLRAFITGK